MTASNGERDISRQLFGYNRPDAVPDHEPVPLVPDDAPKYSVKVIVPHRPGYIGGSGPPMTKLIPQPPYKKTGWMIADSVEEEKGKMSYIVTAKDDPLTRVLVPPEEINQWVSQRTLEDFSCKEYARYEENERLKKKRIQREEAASFWDDEGNQIAPKATSKRKRGRPRRSWQDSMGVDLETFNEVVPAKKDRTAARFREASESEVDAAPSLSQPSLSQPAPNLKRKVSTLFTNESTPGETTDEIADEVLEAIEVRQSKKLNIRENGPNSPKLVKSASGEARPYKTIPSVQIPTSASPFRKQSSAPAPLQKPQSRPSGTATRIIPGTPKPLFPTFGSRQKPIASSEPPRSTTRVLPPERRKPESDLNT